MATFTDKVIVITGASEGIGRALSLALAPQRPRLAIAARNEGRLNELMQELESKGPGPGYSDGCDQRGGLQELDWKND